MPQVVVTGASGFLGGHLTHLAAEKFQTAGFYSSFAFEMPGVSMQAVDFSHTDKIRLALDKFQPDCIIHNAALANPDVCERNPELADLINVKATQTIADWAQANGCRLIYISTDMVFDGNQGFYSENDTPQPLSVYGKSKAAAEKAVLAIHSTAVVCRLALMFGRGILLRPYASTWLERELLSRSKSSDASPLRLFSDQFRSMLSVRNAARAILELCENQFQGILHIGGTERIDRYSFGRRLCAILKVSPGLIQPVNFTSNSTTAPRPKDVSLNITLAQRILKTPLLNIADGLKDAYANPEKA